MPKGKLEHKLLVCCSEEGEGILATLCGLQGHLASLCIMLWAIFPILFHAVSITQPLYIVYLRK